MDWPAFALISYAFVLALLLVVLILRGSRQNKSRYQHILEEKERKLAAMQIDLEETMEALEAQANAAGAQGALKTEADAKMVKTVQALQTHMLGLQSTVMELQFRLTRLERAVRGMDRQPAVAAENREDADSVPATQTQATQDGGAPGDGDRALTAATAAPEAGQQAPFRPRARTDRETDAEKSGAGAAAQAPVGTEGAALHRRVCALLDEGWSVQKISQALGRSSMEISMLENRWRRGYRPEGASEAPQTGQDTEKTV